MKPIGILGGMGPEATILLMQKVVSAVSAKDDADHIPLLVHQNPQVPSRTKALIDGKGTDPMPVLMNMAQDLERAGAQALAMPCNTAHHYALAVSHATSLPFLNMITLTAAHLKMTGAKQIGMLAYPATHMTSVFDAAFEAEGLTPVWSRDDAEILSIIRAVKAGTSREELSQRTEILAKKLITQGADHLLIACTELSLMTHALPKETAHTDSLDCLRDAIVAFAKR